MNDVIFRLSHSTERKNICAFLKKHWDSEFSVVQSKSLFDFLYRDENDNITFVLALRNDEIVGTMGLIVYDAFMDLSKDAFLTLWVSSEQSSGVGLKLLQFIQTLEFRSLSSVGVRPEVLPFYKLFGYQSGMMQHHFILNREKTIFKIFHGNASLLPTIDIDIDVEGFSLTEDNDLREIDVLAFEDTKQIQKTPKYLAHRYKQHPYYQYRIFKLIDVESNTKAIAVARCVEANDSSVMRWVDWIGDIELFPIFSYLAGKIMFEEGHEYADIYSVNIPARLLDLSWFISRKKHDIIIPNFFEPFIQKNEDKYYITSLQSPYLFKGDGDADRPFKLEY